MHTQEILQLLDDHDINYQVFSHPAVFTTKEVDKYLEDEDFAKCKNLLLNRVTEKIIIYSCCLRIKKLTGKSTK